MKRLLSLNLAMVILITMIPLGTITVSATDITDQSSDSEYFSITYQGNGCTTQNGEEYIIRSNIQLGEEYTLDSSMFEPPEGERFLGWSIEQDGDFIFNGWFNPGDTLVLDDSITLYAQWGSQRIDYHNIYNIQDDTDVLTVFSTSNNWNALYTPPALDTHAFIGWNTMPDGSGVCYLPGTTIKDSETYSLYAQYVSVNGDYVLYHGNGSTTPSGESYVVHSGFSSKENSVLAESLFEAPEGKLFLGWSPTPNSLTIYDPGETYDPSKYTTLYARWGTNKVVQHCTYPNGRISVTARLDQTQMGFTSYPISNNHIFTGWNTMPDGSGIWYSCGDPVKNNTVLHLYAQWEELPSYYYLTTDWKTSTGRAVDVFPLESEIQTIILPTSTGGNRSLFGWYDTTTTDNTVSGQQGFLDEATNIYAPGSSITVNSGTKLTALSTRWGIFIDYFRNTLDQADTKRTYYHVTSGSNLQLYSASEVFDISDSMQKFAGWNTTRDGTGTWYSSTDAVSEGYHTLYAQWVPNIYTVTFDTNGGSIIASTSASYGTKITPPANPTRDGYTFAGWFANTELTIIYDFTTMVAKDITLYAKWIENSTSAETEDDNDDYYIPTTNTITRKNDDGSTTTIITNKVTGTVTETNKTADGVTGTVVTDKTGEVTGISASVPAAAAQAANEDHSVISLPVAVPVADNADEAVEMQIDVPAKVDSVTVEIPVGDMTPGLVAILVDEKGNETVVNTTGITENGVVVTLTEDTTLKIVTNAKTFEDVASDDWYSDAAAFVSSRELMNGMTEDTFGHNVPTSRAMVAQILHNMEGTPSHNTAITFDDVDIYSWYSDAIHWAAENGIISGLGDGIFAPNSNITREQLVVMLWKYAGSPMSSYDVSHFTDAGMVSIYASEAIRWAVENSLISGKGNGILDPTGYATRAEVASILMKFYENVKY